MSILRLSLIALWSLLALAPARAEEPLAWRGWGDDLFAQARAENRFVLLDLEAVWCHWCHVMEETTYRDPKVVALMRARYLPVRVDQDANPDLSNRYGNWGWPATIVFAPDGTEIVKRRGYIPPEGMAAMLQAIIDDPSPGPSVMEEAVVTPLASAFMAQARRAEIAAAIDGYYEAANGGWGTGHKFLDTDFIDLALARAEAGDTEAAARARRTLDQALKLIDREWGGIYQYSDEDDWSSPHYEKIMWYQAQAARHYAQAYALFGDPAYLAASRDVARFLLTRLGSPEGAFHTSQDADVDRAMHGKQFYAMSAAERAAFGRAPRIDTSIYARENGWAASGLVHHANASGDAAALAAAEQAMAWIVAHRRRADGLFSHGESDRGGPFLGDTLAVGQAGLDLYAATGKRVWLRLATEAGAGIAQHFRSPDGGFVTSLSAEGDVGVFLKPVKPMEEQIAATRFANLLHRYTGDPAFRELAEHGMRYVAAAAGMGEARPMPGVLLADEELALEPVHITIVGRKDDQRSGKLHAAGRGFAALYKRLDWWDMREGPLPNPDVQYPELDQPAAFACTNQICSLPVFDAKDLAPTVSRMLEQRVAKRE